jgi:hypothetical protein
LPAELALHTGSAQWGNQRWGSNFKCLERSTQPIPRRRTAPQAPPSRIQANADNRKPSRPSLLETPSTASVINIYRTLVSGLFRRKDFGFVVRGKNLASISRFVAGIRRGRKLRSRINVDVTDGAIVS